MKHFPRAITLGLPVVLTAAVLSVIVWSQGESLDAILMRDGPKGVPIPFVQSSKDDGLGASLIQIGQTGSGQSIPVFLVELSDAVAEDLQEDLTENAIYLVRTASVAETVPFDMAFDPITGREPDYFLYKYSDGDATQEIANQNAATFAERFPGTFGASTQAWINEVQHNNALSMFEQANNVDFISTGSGAGSIRFEAHALYALVVNETQTVTIDTVADVVCGDGWKATSEQCDDDNVMDEDGCSALCTIEVASSSSSSVASSSSSESSASSSVESSSSSESSSSVSSSSESSSSSVSSESSSSSVSSESSSSSSVIAFDIALHHDESPVKHFGPASTDKERGDLLRQAVSEMQNGDLLALSGVRFDIDCKNKGNLRFPNNITVSGEGMNVTHLFGDCWSDNQSSAFEVRNGTFQDLAFENQSWDTFEDGRTIQMYDGSARTANNVSYLLDANNQKIYLETNVGPFTATFDRVKFIGTAWTIYDWSARGHTFNIRDSEIISGRQGVSMMSGGGNMANVNILRTRFDIDTMRTRDIGWTSRGNPPVGGGYAVVSRGGHATIEDSEFHMKCGDSPHVSSFVPRCVGVYDGNDFDSTSSSFNWITLRNNTWFIDGDFYGNESVDTYDIFMTNTGAKDKLIIEGSCGSGTGCAVLKNW